MTTCVWCGEEVVPERFKGIQVSPIRNCLKAGDLQVHAKCFETVRHTDWAVGQFRRLGFVGLDEEPRRCEHCGGRGAFQNGTRGTWLVDKTYQEGKARYSHHPCRIAYAAGKEAAKGELLAKLRAVR